MADRMISSLCGLRLMVETGLKTLSVHIMPPLPYNLSINSLGATLEITIYSDKDV